MVNCTGKSDTLKSHKGPKHIIRRKITSSPSCVGLPGGSGLILCEEHIGTLSSMITFSISLGVYLKTVSPSISGGDSGELVAEGCKLGTAHPPGYPLYTVLVFVATEVGKYIGNPDHAPAYFVNLASCFFGALASSLISASVFHLSRYFSPIDFKLRSKHFNLPNVPLAVVTKASVALTAGLLHTFSPLAWQYSTTAEVFALHNLFISSIIYIAVQFATKKSHFLVSLGAFLCGLSLTNQHTSVLLEVPLIIWVFAVTRMYKQGRFIIKTAGWFFLGLSLYCTLPYFALRRPNPGSWGDVTTVSGFLHHLTRKDYGTMRLYSGNDTDTEGLSQRLFLWLGDFAFAQSNPTTVFFALYGSIVLWNKNKPTNKYSDDPNDKKNMKDWNTTGVGRMLVVSLLFYLFVFHMLANLPLENRLLFGIHQRFWMHPNIMCFIFAGVGLSQFASDQKKGMTVFLHIIMLASVVYSYQKNFSSSDQRSNMHFHNYARGILDPLPKDSLLFINYDQQWTSVRYMQECEGIRTDVTSINLSMMSYQWWKSKHELYSSKVVFPGTHYTMKNTEQWLNGGFTFAEILNANYNSFPGGIFLGGQLNYPDTEYLQNYTEIPHGMTRRFVNKFDGKYNMNNIEKYRHDSCDSWKVIAKYHINNLPDERKYPEETWEWTINREFFHHIVSRATHLLDLAVKLEGEKPVLRSLVEAAAWLEMVALRDEFSVIPSLKKNLGLAYMHMVRNKEAAPFLPTVDDIFADAGNVEFMGDIQKVWWVEGRQKERDWKSWASTRWSETWSDFLQMEGADDDPSFDQIKIIYEKVMGVAKRKTKTV